MDLLELFCACLGCAVPRESASSAYREWTKLGTHEGVAKACATFWLLSAYAVHGQYDDLLFKGISVLYIATRIDAIRIIFGRFREDFTTPILGRQYINNCSQFSSEQGSHTSIQAYSVRLNLPLTSRFLSKSFSWTSFLQSLLCTSVQSAF